MARFLVFYSRSYVLLVYLMEGWHRERLTKEQATGKCSVKGGCKMWEDHL